MPPGARIGGYGLNTPPGAVLFNRLREHALSIEQAEDLDLTDFRCQYLVVDDIWIPLAETLLIEMYQPVWNTIVSGFGNHASGKGIPAWNVQPATFPPSLRFLPHLHI